MTPCGVDRKRSFEKATHNVAEVDQEGLGDDWWREPLARRQADRKPGHLGARESGHEAIVGVRRLAKGIVIDGTLRRIVQKPQIGVGFVGKIRAEVIWGKAERDGEG